MKDLVIIGAGPAGLTGGIYGMRAGLDLVIIEKFSPGGQVVKTYEIENYPGFTEPIEGWDLMSRMEEQTRKLGAEIISGDVISVTSENGIFRTLTDNGTIESRTVIIASGSDNRRLGIPGEAEFTGRGVSYCATCDGAFFKDRVTVVAGGGDTALEEAHFLARFSSRVYLVHRRDSFRGADILQKRALSSDRIVPLYNSLIESINGDTSVKSVTVKNVLNGEKSDIITDGVFVFIGQDPNSSFVDKKYLNEKNEIIVDMNMKTETDGLFAAGDIRSNSKRQIVTAAADGATAAMGAYEFLTGNHC